MIQVQTKELSQADGILLKNNYRKMICSMISIMFAIIFQNCSNSEEKQAIAWNEGIKRGVLECEQRDSLVLIGRLDSICGCGKTKIGDQERCDSIFYKISN
jgi:hypothetical protein